MPDEVIDESDRTLRLRIKAEKLTREDAVNRAKTSSNFRRWLNFEN